MISIVIVDITDSKNPITMPTKKLKFRLVEGDILYFNEYWWEVKKCAADLSNKIDELGVYVVRSEKEGK